MTVLAKRIVCAVLLVAPLRLSAWAAPTNHDVVTADVVLGGSRHLIFLVDTGSNASALEETVAAELSLQANSSSVVQRNYSHMTRPLVSAHAIIADRDFGEVTLVSYDFSRIRSALGIPIDGVLGLDILKRAPFELNFSSGALKWTGTKVRPRGIRIEYTEKDDQLFIPMTLNATAVHLLLDSGATITTVTELTWNSIGSGQEQTLRGLRSPSRGSGESFLACIKSIEFAGLNSSERALRVQSTTSDGALSQGLQGFIGNDILKQFILHVDLTKHSISVERNPRFRPDPLRFSSPGVQVGKSNDGYIVAGMFEDSPASTSDLEVGDQISSIDGKEISAFELDEVTRMLHRKPGSSITFTVRRGGETHDIETHTSQLLCSPHVKDEGAKRSANSKK